MVHSICFHSPANRWVSIDKSNAEHEKNKSLLSHDDEESLNSDHTAVSTVLASDIGYSSAFECHEDTSCGHKKTIHEKSTCDVFTLEKVIKNKIHSGTLSENKQDFRNGTDSSTIDVHLDKTVITSTVGNPEGDSTHSKLLSPLASQDLQFQQSFQE